MRYMLLALAFLLAACGSSPEPDYYTLLPVEGASGPPLTQTVEIARPTLPGYLDRPDIVRQGQGADIHIDEFHRWSENLDTMFERIVAEDVRQRLHGSDIITEEDEMPVKARFHAEITIDQFNQVGSGQAVLSAQFIIRDAKGCLVAYPEMVKLSVASPDLAYGLSALVGQFADHLAASLVADDKQSASCPAH